MHNINKILEMIKIRKLHNVILGLAAMVIWIYISVRIVRMLLCGEQPTSTDVGMSDQLKLTDEFMLTDINENPFDMQSGIMSTSGQRVLSENPSHILPRRTYSSKYIGTISGNNRKITILEIDGIYFFSQSDSDCIENDSTVSFIEYTALDSITFVYGNDTIGLNLAKK